MIKQFLLNKNIRTMKKNSIVLNESEVKNIINQYGVSNFMDMAINQISDYYIKYSKGDLERMDRVGFLVNATDTIEVMGSRFKNKRICFKVVSFYSKNNKKNLSTVLSKTILCDESTGVIIADVGSIFLTYLRTGATAALATKYMYQSDFKSVGFIGGGCVSQLTALALSRINKNIKVIYVWDIDKKAAKIFKVTIESLLSIAVEIKKPEEFVREIDVLNLSTYADKISVVDNMLGDKKLHINALGADTPGKEEIDVKIINNSKIIFDCFKQAKLDGEINIPYKNDTLNKKSLKGELHEYIGGKRKIKPNEMLTIYDSVGDAIQDLSIIDLFLSNSRIKIDLLPGKQKVKKDLLFRDNADLKDPLKYFVTHY
jgi:alanine dehydrogenase